MYSNISHLFIFFFFAQGEQNIRVIPMDDPIPDEWRVVTMNEAKETLHILLRVLRPSHTATLTNGIVYGTAVGGYVSGVTPDSFFRNHRHYFRNYDLQQSDRKLESGALC